MYSSRVCKIRVRLLHLRPEIHSYTARWLKHWWGHSVHYRILMKQIFIKVSMVPLVESKSHLAELSNQLPCPEKSHETWSLNRIHQISEHSSLTPADGLETHFSPGKMPVFQIKTLHGWGIASSNVTLPVLDVFFKCHVTFGLGWILFPLTISYGYCRMTWNTWTQIYVLIIITQKTR